VTRVRPCDLRVYWPGSGNAWRSSTNSAQLNAKPLRTEVGRPGMSRRAPDPRRLLEWPALAAFERIHDLAGDYINFLQPVRKLVSTTRSGPRLTRRHATRGDDLGRRPGVGSRRLIEGPWRSTFRTYALTRLTEEHRPVIVWTAPVQSNRLQPWQDRHAGCWTNMNTICGALEWLGRSGCVGERLI
jgi:hypothetical protein